MKTAKCDDSKRFAHAKVKAVNDSTGRPEYVELQPSRKSTGYAGILELVDSIRDGRIPRPSGFFQLSKTRDPFVLLLDKTAFGLGRNQVVVRDLAPLVVTNEVAINAANVASLVLLRHKGGLALRLKYRQDVSKERGTLEKNRLPPGIHHPAALQVTKKGRVQIVSGGLSSMGKRK